MAIEDLVYIGFNSRVVALNRDTGQVAWDWTSRSGSGYVTLLLDGDRLIVSVIGYTYCLNPENGQELWFNDLPGYGSGVASIVSVRGSANCALPASDAADEASRRSSHSTIT